MARWLLLAAAFAGGAATDAVTDAATDAASDAATTCDASPWDADADPSSTPLPPVEAVDAPGLLSDAADGGVCARSGARVSAAEWAALETASSDAYTKATRARASPRTDVLDALERLRAAAPLTEADDNGGASRGGGATSPAARRSSMVFVMLNGENEGDAFWHVEGCDGALAARASDALAPARRAPGRRLFLHTATGQPLATTAARAEDDGGGGAPRAAATRLLHLLFEAHPGHDVAYGSRLFTTKQRNADAAAAPGAVVRARCGSGRVCGAASRGSCRG